MISHTTLDLPAGSLVLCFVKNVEKQSTVMQFLCLPLNPTSTASLTKIDITGPVLLALECNCFNFYTL